MAQVKITFIKTIDRIIGKFAIHLVPPPPATSSKLEIRSILIIRPGGIGDAALLAPTIFSLRKNYPSAQIDVLAEKRNCGAFALIPGISRIFLYDRFKGLLDVLRGRYDLAIDTEQWHRLSALIARITLAPFLIGFDTNERRSMFTHPVPYSHDEYEANSFLHLLIPLGIAQDHEDTKPFLFVPKIAYTESASLLSSLESHPFVTIFPGASTKVRLWGSDRFRQVVEHLEANGLHTVVIGGTDERIQGEEIVAGSRALNLAGKTSLAVTAAVIASSKLLLSGDSGILHIGVGLGVPTVSLFGPGISAKWAPRGDRHIVLNKGLPCSPCTRFGSTPPCPHGIRCLSEITPTEVSSAVLQIAKTT